MSAIPLLYYASLNSGSISVPLSSDNSLADPARSDYNAKFSGLKSNIFRIIDYMGFYGKRTDLCARKSALTAPFYFEDKTKIELHMEGRKTQKITQQKTARICVWQADLWGLR